MKVKPTPRPKMPFLTSTYEYISKEDVVAKHVSRFAKSRPMSGEAWLEVRAVEDNRTSFCICDREDESEEWMIKCDSPVCDYRW